MKDGTTFRQATEMDNPAVFRLFMRSVRDLEFRQGVIAANDGGDPTVVARLWEKNRPIFDHLARSAHAFWVAERQDELIGYARSILRDGVLELTEFFVSPDEQSGGVGKELLSRAFTARAVSSRIIIASTDIRAQARYLKSGLYPQFPIYYFFRPPTPAEVASDLQIIPMAPSPEVLEAIGALDREVLGYRRDADHDWFMSARSGYLYLRDGRISAYGYVTRGEGSGPFAVRNATDLPAVLAHAESIAAREGRESFGVQVPMINRVAVYYLLQRGFHIEPDVILFMSDVVHSGLDRYLITSPPFFM
jgi:hypothetical protein